MRKLIIAPSAETDLNAIVDYIAFKLCNPIAANAFLDEVERAYDILEERPLAFPFCDDPTLRMSGYHQIGVKNNIIVYRVEEGTGCVRVLHIYNIRPMELKSAELLKALQKAHEKEPVRMAASVAPDVHGGDEPGGKNDEQF